jgi:hypothetical protein
VTGHHDAVGTGVRGDRRQNGLGAIGRRDAGGHPIARFDGRPECRLSAAGVGRQQRNREPLHPLFGHHQADEPAPRRGHEVHHVGRHPVGRNAQHALSGFGLSVDQEHDAPVLDVGEDGVQRCRHDRHLTTPRD